MPAGGGWSFTADAPVDVSRYLRANSPLKFYVLELCEERGDLDYHDLADDLGMPPHYAADRLVGYARAGLLDRTRAHGSARSFFRLTPRGRDRLAHFRAG